MGRKSPDINFRHPRKLWVCYMLNNNLAAYRSMSETSSSPDISFGKRVSLISVNRFDSLVFDRIIENIGFIIRLYCIVCGCCDRILS